MGTQSATPSLVDDFESFRQQQSQPSIADDFEKFRRQSTSSPQVQWDEESTKPPSVQSPTQPVKRAPVQITSNPALPSAIAEKVRTALPNIAQYPENQQKPDPDYIQRKNAFEAVQTEPGAPQDFQEDPEQERRIKAQEQVASSQSMVPNAAMPALSAFQTHVNEPIERMSQATAAESRHLADRALVTPPTELGTIGDPNTDPPVTEEDVQERLKAVPQPLVGLTRSAFGTAGGVVGDPRMWPFFLAGPEVGAGESLLARARAVSPGLQRAATAGFAGQMAHGTYAAAGELGSIMDNQDVPREDKWEASANYVLSAIMAGQATVHAGKPHVDTSVLAEQFSKLPPEDQEGIRNVLRQQSPEVAAAVDKAAGAQATPGTSNIATDFENFRQQQGQQPAAKPERFRLPRGTSAQEVQGPVKGPNIRTVQVGDKTYAFDQRRINADGVTSAVERNELWRLTGGKAPEAAKMQAEQDVRGEEAPAAKVKPEEKPVEQQTSPEVKWDDEKEETKPKHDFASTQINIKPDSEIGQRHAAAVAAIPEEHIGPNGKEETPHVTVRYGLKDDSPEAVAKIKEAASKIQPFEAAIGKTGSFPATKEGDHPIIAHVEKTPELEQLRKTVEGAGDFKPDDHGEYKPHVTLGYVKPEHLAEHEGGNHLEGGKVPVDHVVVSKKDGTQEVIKLGGQQPERRTDIATRKRVADLTPDERAHELLTSEKTGLPNRRAFDEAESSPMVAMSDADGLKALNDRFGYAAGDALLKAKADALKEAGIDAYHDKGDEFLGRGHSEAVLRSQYDKARRILRNKVITVQTSDGKELQFKGADFSYGTGHDLAAAEAGLKSHKSDREAAGERARGELRGITEVRPGSGEVDHGAAAGIEHGRSGAAAAGSPDRKTLPDKHPNVLEFKPRPQVYKTSTQGEVRGRVLEFKRKIPPSSKTVSSPHDAIKSFGEATALEAHNPKAAMEIYDRLIKDGADPETTVSSWVNRGVLQYNERKFTEAIDSAQRALELDPHHALARYNLANALEDSGQRKEAVSHYEQAIKDAPSWADPYYNLARLQQQLRNNKNALEMYRAFLKRESTGQFAEIARIQITRLTDHLTVIDGKGKSAGKSEPAELAVVKTAPDVKKSEADKLRERVTARRATEAPPAKQGAPAQDPLATLNRLPRSAGLDQLRKLSRALKESGIKADVADIQRAIDTSRVKGTKASDELLKYFPRETPATAQFDEAVKHTGAEVKEGKPSEAFAEKIKEATHLEPANEAELKEKFTGAAYQREYFKAALEPALAEWKLKLSDSEFQKATKSIYHGVKVIEGQGQLYVKVPGDGHFLVNNTPFAIEKALKGATRGFAAPRASFNPEAKAKKFSAPKATPEAVEKYRKELAEELRSADGDKSYAESRLKDDRESRAKSRELTDEFNKDLKTLRASGDPKKGEKERELRDAYNKNMQRLPRQMSDDEIEEAHNTIAQRGADIPVLRQNVADFEQQFPPKDRNGERGSATPSAMPIPALISSAAGVIKKGSDLYHGAVDKALDWAHMGQTRPEIRKFDPDAADLATKMDAGGQYHKAVAEMIGKKVTGPLAEEFTKADNYASRQKKNETSRDRMKGFHFLADAQNREWLEENHPEDFHRWSADPKIKEALDAYKPFEGQLRDAVKQLGVKTIDEDYIKRIMDFATSGVAYEKGLAHGVEGPVELRQGAAAGARGGGGRDNVVSPQIDRSKARKDAGKFYWDHGVFDFGPAFEKRWVEVMSKLDEHRLAVHSMSMGTRIMPDEAMPEKVFYNGQEFYRPDIAKDIREVQKRGVSAESKAMADALGVSELPTPKDVREYANYEPLRRGSRFETAARNLAANVLAGKEGLEAQAANVNRMAKLRYALPKEIVEALNDAGREKELGALSKKISQVLGPLTQFIRQQIVGLSLGIPHMANILRKVVQAQPGGALNPLAWVNSFKVAFSKELKARGISGTEDPTYDMLLRNAAVSEGAVPEYKRYIEGNMDADNWAQTLGNAFKKGGKEGAKVTPLSAAAGLGRLAIEPLNRFSEAGHANLFKPGGIDQRARLWLGDFLKDRYPGMNEQRIAHEVNQTLGRYNRASWTDVQRNLGPLMLFPGWDYSSMAFALKHPFKTAVAPAVLMLLANAAVHSIGSNKNDEKNDLERVHIGKYSARTNLFNDNMGTHMWGWALRGAKAGLDHKNAKQATGEIVKGVPGDVAGVTTGTMNPILSTPIQVGANRVSPGRAEEIAKTGDFKKKGKILPNKAAEDYADFAARRAFPIYDRATQAGQRPSLASFAGLAGVNISEQKKKKR